MTPDTIALESLNDVPAEHFAALLAGIVEHAPEIAASVASARPFDTVAALHDAFMDVIAALPRAGRIALVNRHPELAGREAKAGEMTSESVSEQGSVGLDRLSAEAAERLRRLNRAYRDRFGFPFMICVRRHSRGSIFAEAERRLGRSAEEELEEALRQIRFVTRLRIVDRVEGPGLPRVAGELTAHVLDRATGAPAAGIRVALFNVSEPGEERPVASAVTGTDGRPPRPVLAGRPLPIGTYEFRFDDAPGNAPARFAITEAEGYYDIALTAASRGGPDP